MSAFVTVSTDINTVSSFHYSAAFLIEEVLEVSNFTLIYLRAGNTTYTINAAEHHDIIKLKIDVAAKADKTEWTT